MINVIDPTPETSDQKVHTKDSSGYDTIFFLIQSILFINLFL